MRENPFDQLLLFPSATAGNINSKLDALRTALEARAITSDDFHSLQQEQDIRAFIQRHDLIDVQNDVKRIIQERLSFFFLPTVSQLTLPLKKTTEIPTKSNDKSSHADQWKDDGIPKTLESYQISGLHSCQTDVYYRCTILRTKEVVTTSYRFYLDSITPLQACTISTTSNSHNKKTVANTNTTTTAAGRTKKTLWFAAKKMKAGGGGLIFFQLEYTKDWVEKNAIGKVSTGRYCLHVPLHVPFSIPILQYIYTTHTSPHSLSIHLQTHLLSHIPPPFVTSSSNDMISHHITSQ